MPSVVACKLSNELSNGGRKGFQRLGPPCMLFENGLAEGSFLRPQASDVDMRRLADEIGGRPR